MKTFNLMIISFVLMVFTISLAFLNPICYEVVLTIYGTMFGLATLYFADININKKTGELRQVNTNYTATEVGLLRLSTYTILEDDLMLLYAFKYKDFSDNLIPDDIALKCIKEHHGLDLKETDFIGEYGVKYYTVV